MARQPENPFGNEPLQRSNVPPIKKVPTIWTSPVAKPQENYAPAPTQDEVKKANEGKLGDKGIVGAVTGFAHDHPLIATELGLVAGSTVLAGIVTGIYALTHPGIFQKVPENTSFNNGELVFEVSSSNTVQLTQDEINALPKVDEDGKPIYLFPFGLDKEDALKITKQGVEKDGQTLYGGITI